MEFYMVIWIILRVCLENKTKQLLYGMLHHMDGLVGGDKIWDFSNHKTAITNNYYNKNHQKIIFVYILWKRCCTVVPYVWKEFRKLGDRINSTNIFLWQLLLLHNFFCPRNNNIITATIHISRKIQIMTIVYRDKFVFPKQKYNIAWSVFSHGGY